MDDRRFDALVRQLASGQSRRSVLKGLLGLTGVALAGSAATESTDAARRLQPIGSDDACFGKAFRIALSGKCLLRTFARSASSGP